MRLPISEIHLRAQCLLTSFEISWIWKYIAIAMWVMYYFLVYIIKYLAFPHLLWSCRQNNIWPLSKYASLPLDDPNSPQTSFFWGAGFSYKNIVLCIRNVFICVNTCWKCYFQLTFLFYFRWVPNNKNGLWINRKLVDEKKMSGKSGFGYLFIFF